MDNLENLKDNLITFRAYIGAEVKFADLKKKMKAYNQHPVQLNRDFFLIAVHSSLKPITDESGESLAESILKKLNIHPDKWAKYTSLPSFYSFFDALANNGHEQCNVIIKLIEEKRSIIKLKIIFGSLFSACVITFILTNPAFAGFVALINSFINLAISIPIVSLVYTGVVALYSLYQNQFSTKKLYINRFWDNFFLLSSSALNIAGYGILIASSAVMSPVVGALYVAASAINVFKEAATLLYERWLYNSPRTSPAPVGSLIAEQAELRHKLSYEKHMSALLVNLVASIVLVAVMALWCFLPATFLVTVVSIVSMGAVYVVNALINHISDQRSRDKMQEGLESILAKHQKSEAQYNSNSHQRMNKHLIESPQSPSPSEPAVAPSSGSVSVSVVTSPSVSLRTQTIFNGLPSSSDLSSKPPVVVK